MLKCALHQLSVAGKPAFQRSRRARSLASTQAKTRRPKSSQCHKVCLCSAPERLVPCQETRAARLLDLSFDWGIQPELTANPSRGHTRAESRPALHGRQQVFISAWKHRDETDAHVLASRCCRWQTSQMCHRVLPNLWDCFLCISAVRTPSQR